ncbi:MAG: NAD-dependent epimerase/dehydratase family protein [Planctomycetota bacterium]
MKPLVLITGGAGFIGSHLTRELLGRGLRVSVLDDLSTGEARNMDPHRHNPDFTFHAGSFTQEDLLAELVDRADHVVHLAAAVGVMLIVEDPVRTIETNILGTELVLRNARKKLKPVVIASTSEVYGKGASIPFREDDDVVLGPTSKSRWSYAASKMVDEFMGLAYHKQHALPVRIVRFFNTVGPGQVGRYGMVIPRLVAQALQGEALTVYGDGAQQRCFADVSDVVRGVADMMACPAAVGQVYNLGNDREISIMELAQRVNALTGNKAGIVKVPYEKAYGEGFEDMRRRVPDLTKARTAFGYQPKVDTDSILRRVIEHMKGAQV